ncbi:MAG: class I adenylate-forming enzyme family protein [Miltoncostaeaceae bacterium]
MTTAGTPSATAIRWFLDRLDAHPVNSPAIIDGDSLITFGEIAAHRREWASSLAVAGVRPGDVVSLHADHGAPAVAALLGAFEVGAIVVPIAPQVPAARALALADVAQPIWRIDPFSATVIATPRGSLDAPPYERVRERGHPGLVLFTSGTGGLPKGVVHDVASLVERFRTPRPPRRVAAFLLFDHIGGVNTVLHSLANGGCVVTMTDRDPHRVAARIAVTGVEVLPTTPTFLHILVASGATGAHDLSSLSLVTYGTEVMTDSTLAAVRRALPGVRLLQTYGMSELGILRSRSDDDTAWVSIGGPEVEWRVEGGTLRIRARTAMVGYLNAPDPFDHEGWFDTGDEVLVDGDRLRFLGRRDDAINIGGQKVHPAIIESVIADIPGVRDVSVHGEPHPITGMAVVASVLFDGDLARAEARSLIRTACLRDMEPWQVPTRIVFVEDFRVTDRFKRARGDAASS